MYQLNNVGLKKSQMKYVAGKNIEKVIFISFFPWNKENIKALFSGYFQYGSLVSNL